MTTTRKLIITGTAVSLIGLLAIGGVLYSRTGKTQSAQAAISIAAQGTKSVDGTLAKTETDDTTSSSIAQRGSEGGSENDSEDTLAALSSTTEQDDPGAVRPIEELAVGVPEPSAEEASYGDSSSRTGQSGLAGGLIGPGTLPRITADLAGPAIGAIECHALNYFEVYLTDDSGIASASVSYADGPVITRTTPLIKLDHHGDGNYYVGFLVHTSPIPLSKFMVTAKDTRGNTTVKNVRVSCP